MEKKENQGKMLILKNRETGAIDGIFYDRVVFAKAERLENGDVQVEIIRGEIEYEKTCCFVGCEKPATNKSGDYQYCSEHSPA